VSYLIGRQKAYRYGWVKKCFFIHSIQKGRKKANMPIDQTHVPASDQKRLDVWEQHGAWLGIAQVCAGIVALVLTCSRPSSLVIISLNAVAWVIAISARAFRAPDPRLPASLKHAVFRRRVIWRFASVMVAFTAGLLVASIWTYNQELQIFNQSPLNENAVNAWENMSNLLGILGAIALAVASILWIVGLLVGRGDAQARAERAARRQANKQRALTEAAKKYGRLHPSYSAGYRTHTHTSKPANEMNVPQERVSVQIGEGTITYDGQVLRAVSGRERQEVELSLAKPEARKPDFKDPAGPVASIIAFHERYTIESAKYSSRIDLHQVALLDLAGRRVLIWNTAPLSPDDHHRLGKLAEEVGIPYDYYDFGDTGSTTPRHHEAYFPLAPGAYVLAPRKIKSLAGIAWLGGAIVAVTGLIIALAGGIGGKNLSIALIGLLVFVCATALAWVGMARVPNGPPRRLK
jgi:hypothetical protein